MPFDEPPTAGLKDYLKSWPLYPLPHHWLSRIMLALTRVENPTLVPPAIRLFCRHFEVDLQEARETAAEGYASFNAFFTRALKSTARPLDKDPRSLCSPADGAISQCGSIHEGRIFQAKGRDYSLEALLGGDTARAAHYAGGEFCTIYLSPRDYHRVHMPVSADLLETLLVPGRLFSVAPHTVRAVPGLFARNERLIAHFDTAVGPMAMILVGAIFVACIETVWTGVATPPHPGHITPLPHKQPLHLEKGAEMGRFNMGSTVILLFGPDRVQWSADCHPEAAVRMGQRIAMAR